jgi:hypothetical protein
MDEERSARMCREGSSVYDLAQAIETAGGAYVVGGALYQELARTALRYRPRLARWCFASGSYLQQRKQLGEFLRFTAIHETTATLAGAAQQGELFAA